MTRTMRITADASKVSMAASIRATAKAVPLLVLTTRALGELARELGGTEAAASRGRRSQNDGWRDVRQ